MKITNLHKTEKIYLRMEGARNVEKQLPISAGDGSPIFSFRVFTIHPDGHTPFHAHPSEHLNYIIAGKGAVVSETGEEHPLETGDFILVLPNEKHQYKNRSDSEPFVMICAVPKKYE